MLDDLDLFLLVAAHGSVNKAAKHLRLPKSTVSRRLANLEARLGASLFLRDAAGMTLTHAGKTLRAECEGPMGVLRGALASVCSDLAALEGTVRVALPRTFATFVCPPVLRTFAERHRDVILELELDDAATDPAMAGWDASIRIGPLPPGDLRVRLLGEVRGVLVASPAYIARHGTPEPESVASHRGLIFRSQTFGARWDMIDPAGAPRTFEPSRSQPGVDFGGHSMPGGSTRTRRLDDAFSSPRAPRSSLSTPPKPPSREHRTDPSRNRRPEGRRRAGWAGERAHATTARRRRWRSAPSPTCRRESGPCASPS